MPSAKMRASKSHELETDIPASELWKIYGTLRFVETQVLQKVEVVRGHGGVGTVIQVTVLPPGNPSPLIYKEDFAKIDNENYVKVAPAIEGDILSLGFIKFVTRLEIIRKGPNSSVIKSSVEYEYDDGRPEVEAAVSTQFLALAAVAIAKYVKDQKANQASS